MLDITKDQVLAELQGRVGHDKGIHGRQLVRAITGATEDFDQLERKVRDHVQALRLDGEPICAHPASGYYMAEAGTNELNATCRFLLDRAVTSVNQVAALKKCEPPDLYTLLGVPPPPKTN